MGVVKISKKYIMNLVTLISKIMDPVKLDQFYIQQALDVESEALIIYMKESLSIDSEIYIFPIEETEDDLVFEKDGIKYIQLFPVEYALELIESDLGLKDELFTDQEIAGRLLMYRLKDA